MKNLFPLALFVLVLAACGTRPTTRPASDSPVSSSDTPVAREPSNMPYAPQPKDANLSRGNVFIEAMEILIRESYPPQITLELSGNLPNPCHELRAVIHEQDAENKINVEMYTVVDPNVMCTEVLKAFQENIDLGTFPSGHYSVWVNGEMAGEFDA